MGTSGFKVAPDLADRSSVEEVGHIQAALDSRDIIGQAKGIVRLLAGTDSDTAFAALCRLSQDTNRKIRDVATTIADCAATGDALPEDIARSWQRWVTPTPGAQSA
jgi:ANTAR domain